MIDLNSIPDPPERYPIQRRKLRAFLKMRRKGWYVEEICDMIEWSKGALHAFCRRHGYPYTPEEEDSGNFKSLKDLR